MRIVPPQTRHDRPASPGFRLALLGAAAVLLAGCGSQLVKVNSSVLRLRMDEYSITPANVQVHAGRLKIVAVNTGILTHNVKVESMQPGPSGNVVVVGGTPIALPGQKVTGKVMLTPGTYKLLDTIGNHAELGDYAELIVK